MHRDRQGHQLLEYVGQLQLFLRSGFYAEASVKIERGELSARSMQSIAENTVVSLLLVTETLKPGGEVHWVVLFLRCGLSDLAYGAQADFDKCRDDTPKMMVKKLSKKGWENKESNLIQSGLFASLCQ